MIMDNFVNLTMSPLRKGNFRMKKTVPSVAGQVKRFPIVFLLRATHDLSRGLSI